MLQQQLNIPKPKEYLKSQFKSEVILLDGCGFSRAALPALKD